MYEDIELLADVLVKISKIKHLKYPFLRIHFKKLVEKWNSTNSKFEIHVFDLPKYLIVNFDENGREMLCKLCTHLKDEYGLEKLKKIHETNVYKLYGFIRKLTDGISIKSLVELFDLLKLLGKEKMLNLENLEKHIIEIKTRRCKSFKPNGCFPIHLNDEKWAPFFGLMLDSGIHKFQFYSIKKESHDEIRVCLKSLGCEITEYQNKTVANSMFSTIFSLAGLDISNPQQISNNPLPYWIFTKTSDKFKAILITKAFEAEGSFSKSSRDIRITQSTELKISNDQTINLKKLSKKEIIKNSFSIILKIGISKIPENIKDIIIENPPLILVSLQILLRKFKINSNVCPSFVYIKSNDKVATMWDLHINGKDIDKFRELCFPHMVLNKFDNFRKRKENISPNTRMLYYLLLAKEAENKKGYFFIKDVISISHRKPKNIWNNLALLKRKGFVKTVEKIGMSNKLKISKEGYEFLNQNINSMEEWNYLFE